MMSYKRRVSARIKETWRSRSAKGTRTVCKSLYILASLHLYIFLASCSTDYRSALPIESTAIAAIEAADTTLMPLTAQLQGLLGIAAPADCGLDLGEPLYLFTTADGTLGFCAKTGDADRLTALMQRQTARGAAREIARRQGCQYYNVKDVCVAGWNGTSLIAIGPVAAAQEGDAIARIARLLRQDTDESALAGPLTPMLDSLAGPLRIVARATALPEPLRPLLTLGLPRDGDPEQCLVTASATFRHDMLTLDVTPRSLRQRDERALRQALKRLNPVSRRYLTTADSTAEVTVTLNAEGRDLLPMLTAQPATAAMLAAADQAIDLTAMLRAVSGEVTLAASHTASHTPQLTLRAELATTAFMNDVQYWRQTLPKGCRLTPWGARGCRLESPETELWLDVAGFAPPQLFVTNSDSEAARHRLRAHGSAPRAPQATPMGHAHLAVTVNVKALTRPATRK